MSEYEVVELAQGTIKSLDLGGGASEAVDLSGSPVEIISLGGGSVEIVTPVVAGPRGPKGDKGDKGDAGEPGVSGEDGRPPFIHHQINPAATWSITHNRDIFTIPTILLEDEPERPVVTDVVLPDSNTAVLIFPTPVSGWAYFIN